jgi:hypothetical protein
MSDREKYTGMIYAELTGHINRFASACERAERYRQTEHEAEFADVRRIFRDVLEDAIRAAMTKREIYAIRLIQGNDWRDDDETTKGRAE